MKKRFIILIIFILLIGVGFVNSLPHDPNITIDNPRIVKEKVKLIEDSGVIKHTNYNFVLNYYTDSPLDSYAYLTYFDKNDNIIGQKNFTLQNYNNDIYLGKVKGVKKVNLLIYQGEGNILYDTFGYKNLLYNKTITKITKNNTVIDASSKDTVADTSNSDYSSSGTDHSSYNSDYSSSYDSSYSYDSDYSGSSYASEPVSGGSYVASKNSDKFHTSSCGHGERIKSSNRIYFSSRQEALNSGYSPCKHCNP